MADEATPAIPEVPEDLDALNDAELLGLHGELAAARAALLLERTADGVTFARIREIRAAIQGIDASLNAINVASTERMEVMTELNAAEQAEVPALAETPETPPVPAPGPDAPPETKPEPAAPGGEQVPVTAAITVNEIVNNREPGSAPPPSETHRPRVASLMAPSNSSQSDAGTELSLEDIGSRVTELARGGPELDNPVKTRVASIPAFEGTSGLRESMLRNNQSAETNDGIIREAVGSWRQQYDARKAAAAGAHVAAICDPLDIIREIPDCTQATTPFQDSLPSRPASRLGFQFTPSMSINDMAAGMTTWTDANQAAVDPANPATWKPCVFVDCPTASPVRAKAIPACFTFDNTLDMSNPERVRDAMLKMSALRARNTTAYLLDIANGLAHHYDYDGPYGAMPSFIGAVLSILPQGEYAERLDDGTPYVLYTPPGLLEALVIDRDSVGYLSDVVRGQATTFIEQECAAAGWNVSVVDIDDVAVGQAAPFAPLNGLGVANRTALPGLGGKFQVQLLAPEAALYFSTGDINYGIERSPELNRQNRAQFFAEEYVGLAKHGCHPWYTLHVDLCENGARAGLVTPLDCADTRS